jgi:hypothetical protein
MFVHATDIGKNIMESNNFEANGVEFRPSTVNDILTTGSATAA